MIIRSRDVVAGTRRKKRLRGLVEFGGLREWSRQRNRDIFREQYDGPKGAVLTLTSLVSLHGPLIGQLLRSGRFDISRFNNILDVGSGTGQILAHLLRSTDARIVGFDISHNMLCRARGRLKSDRPALFSCDMTSLPFADESFDCITCGYVIEHLADPEPGLLEFGRVLKPEGSLLLLVTEDTLSGSLVSRAWKCRTHNRQELEIICESVGLPWKEEIWLTRFHRFMKMGGIIVEATKPAAESCAADP